MNIIMRVYSFLLVVVALVFVAASYSNAVSPLDPIFAAFDISTVATALSTALVAVLGVRLLFVGYKYVKTLMAKA